MHGLRQFTVAEKVIEEKDVKANAEFHGQRGDNTLKADFQDFDLATFCQQAGLEYPILSDRDFKLLIPFANTYRCEAGFPTAINIKTKARNRLDLSHDLRCALAVTKSPISKLVKQK
jgi:hypothetical protein